MLIWNRRSEIQRRRKTNEVYSIDELDSEEEMMHTSSGVGEEGGMLCEEIEARRVEDLMLISHGSLKHDAMVKEGIRCESERARASLVI